MPKNRKPLEHHATAAFELFGGRAFLHLTVAFPRNESDRALWGGTDYHVRFPLR